MIIIPAEVKIRHDDGKGMEVFREYTQRLKDNGFEYSYLHPGGGGVYCHEGLNLEVYVHIV